MDIKIGDKFTHTLINDATCEVDNIDDKYVYYYTNFQFVPDIIILTIDDFLKTWRRK